MVSGERYKAMLVFLSFEEDTEDSSTPGPVFTKQHLRPHVHKAAPQAPCSQSNTSGPVFTKVFQSQLSFRIKFYVLIYLEHGARKSCADLYMFCMIIFCHNAAAPRRFQKVRRQRIK